MEWEMGREQQFLELVRVAEASGQGREKEEQYCPWRRRRRSTASGVAVVKTLTYNFRNSENITVFMSCVYGYIPNLPMKIVER